MINRNLFGLISVFKKLLFKSKKVSAVHYCKRCHRVLKNPVAIALGYGSKCYEHGEQQRLEMKNNLQLFN